MGTMLLKEETFFIWGIRGNSGGEFGHTGIFIDENMIIHCNASTNVGITINSYDQYWVSAGRPTAAIYRFGGASKPYPGDSSGSKRRFSESFSGCILSKYEITGKW
ncbi:hypothetical protein DKB98_14685 [Enterococcus faecalis]|nr:hypothetical protein DKB98_14685 [Enterococcus faecalis]